MSIFQLQQFAINQSRSGMKICSDSLLFGALIPIEGAKRVLDIGAGTGILSLMQAQKSNDVGSIMPKITAVELTHAAAEEARENFDNSPWSQQLELIEQDIQSFAKQQLATKQTGYDLIICNPPFFAEQSKTASNKPLRQTARHTDTLSFEDLINSIDLLLTATGKVFILLPITALASFYQLAENNSLYLSRQMDIAESREHNAKVTVLEFSRENPKQSIRIQQLNKFQQPNVHSDAVQKLLQPFLLRYA